MDIELSFSVSSYLIYAVFILDRCVHCFVPLSACHMSQSQVTNVHVQYKVHVSAATRPPLPQPSDSRPIPVPCPVPIPGYKPHSPYTTHNLYIHRRSFS